MSAHEEEIDELGRPTHSSGVRKLECFLDATSRRHVYLEVDIFWAHVARYGFRPYTARDGSTRTGVFDPLKLVRQNEKRFPSLRYADLGHKNLAALRRR